MSATAAVSLDPPSSIWMRNGMSGGRGAANGAGEAAATMETASTSGAFTASVLSFMRESAPAAPSNRRGAAGIIRGNGRRNRFRYDPCFGARTFIPWRFTSTSIFSAGFDDGGRPYVTTS